jgi:hypothetical protein
LRLANHTERHNKTRPAIETKGGEKGMTKSKTASSTHVRFGKRTYFFDVNVTAGNKKYLKITESKFVEEGKPRIYNSFVLFPSELEDFQNSLSEAVASLKA